MPRYSVDGLIATPPLVPRGFGAAGTGPGRAFIHLCLVSTTFCEPLWAQRGKRLPKARAARFCVGDIYIPRRVGFRWSYGWAALGDGPFYSARAVAGV